MKAKYDHHRSGADVPAAMLAYYNAGSLAARRGETTASCPYELGQFKTFWLVGFTDTALTLQQQLI
ncbi:hypothetical protein EDC56_1939 [Sinobacterium caligoides]|uniref:Uncharacterized protein n=1 Tax=Sinobacterium caligoides TaxID=933926 RepID=A0A3N2DNX4_9GAMM|nr:Rmf/CrpP family protein [Sinobacterium caligoides]ROS01497.1 hypothetical protein EDC56_1939 [Sinobacterium caligoides]